MNNFLDKLNKKVYPIVNLAAAAIFFFGTIYTFVFTHSLFRVGKYFGDSSLSGFGKMPFFHNFIMRLVWLVLLAFLIFRLMKAAKDDEPIFKNLSILASMIFAFISFLFVTSLSPTSKGYVLTLNIFMMLVSIAAIVIFILILLWGENLKMRKKAQPYGYQQQGMPQQGMPQQGMPQQGMPQQGMPQQGYPQQDMPQQNSPMQNQPPQN